MACYLTLDIDDTAPTHAGEWITAEGQRAAWPTTLCYQITSCVVEAINNAVAYADSAPTNEIKLKLLQHHDWVIICIRDQGPSAEGKLTTELPEADTIGGRGWFIINSWMDCARYSRCGNHNVVTMAKQLSEQ